MKVESQHTHNLEVLGRWIEYIVWPDVLCHVSKYLGNITKEILPT